MWLSRRHERRDDAVPANDVPASDVPAALATESGREAKSELATGDDFNDLGSALGLSEPPPSADQLPNVPAWILEAREALRTSSPSQSVDGDLNRAKLTLSGSEFPWPEATKPEDPEEMPEPIEPDPRDEPQNAPTEEPVAIIAPDPLSEDDRQDEIERLGRKAEKARRRADEARDLTVQFAREGRRKKARSAAKMVYEQADRAKRLEKRARKLADQ